MPKRKHNIAFVEYPFKRWDVYHSHTITDVAFNASKSKYELWGVPFVLQKENVLKIKYAKQHKFVYLKDGITPGNMCKVEYIGSRDA